MHKMKLLGRAVFVNLHAAALFIHIYVVYIVKRSPSLGRIFRDLVLYIIAHIPYCFTTGQNISFTLKYSITPKLWFLQCRKF